MSNWIVFSGPNCPWCTRAKDLLAERGYEYEEIRIDSKEKFQFMQEYAPGVRTVPVIVHNGVAIAGYDALVKYLDTV